MPCHLDGAWRYGLGDNMSTRRSWGVGALKTARHFAHAFSVARSRGSEMTFLAYLSHGKLTLSMESHHF